MILSGDEIKKQVKNGNLVISPFVESQINPNSYNYRIGTTYIEIPGDDIIDSKKGCSNYKLKKIPSNGLLLKKGNLYICNTLEKIGSDKYVTSLIGKSSMGRLGLFIQTSADLGHQGQIHKWTLELRCTKDTIIYPNMVIGQISFWNTHGQAFSSNAYYTHFDVPTPSKGIGNDFNR